jgi:hypothetical protein
MLRGDPGGSKRQAGHTSADTLQGNRNLGTFPRSSKLRGLSLHNPKTPSHTRAWLLPHTAFTSVCASWWTPPFSPRKACDEERPEFAISTSNTYFTHKFRTTQEYNPRSLFSLKAQAFQAMTYFEDVEVLCSSAFRGVLNSRNEDKGCLAAGILPLLEFPF